MLPLNLPKLYPITDIRLSGVSHAEQVQRFAAAGATFVQLREKHLSPRDFYEEAAEAIRVARRCGVRLIINDRADIALAARADGVHLGQDDLWPDAARRVLGEDAIIGCSTHSVRQALEAARLSVNYIAIGPIFATLSKENPDPVVGLDGLRQVRAELRGDVPLVAIGGINRTNAADVIKAGADAVAVISTLFTNSPAEITQRTQEMLAML